VFWLMIAALLSLSGWRALAGNKRAR